MARENFIGGAWVPARSGATDAVLDPATGEPLDEVASSDAADVDDAVAAAADAFDAWSDTHARGSAARCCTQGRRRDRGRPGDAAASSRSRNVGKPLSIIEFEMDLTVDNWRFFAGGARFLEGRAAGEYMEGHTSFLRRDPLGVVASIAPWNYPLNMATWKVGPALAAGNTVVLKPSELTPLTALRLAEITADILPPGVLNVVTGDGEHAGAALVTASRRRDGVAHRRRRDRQGDRPGGRRLAQARAPRARRQGAGDRVRRRRHRRAGRDPHRDRLLQLGPGLHRAVPRARGPGVFDGLVSRAHRDRSARSRPATRSPRTPRWARSCRPTQLERVAGMVDRARRRGRRGHDGRRAPRRRRLLLRAVGGREPGPGRRDRAARGVRPVDHRAALRRRGRRRSRGPTTSTTASPSSVWTRDVGRAMRMAKRPRSSAPCGSTTTSRSCPSSRTAASSSRATARTCRSTRSSTTPRSST